MKSTSDRNSVFNCIAFIVLIVVAILEIFSGLSAIGVDILGATLMNLLNTVKNIGIIIVVGIYAYRFVESKSKSWKIVYFIAIAVFIAATILMWIK